MKALIIIISLIFAINCYSQITTIAVKEKKDTIEVQKYDSLESFDYENVMQHVGQTLFIKGSEFTKEYNGFFQEFFTKRTTDNSYTYKPIPDKENKYLISSYSELVGKYYKILSVTSESPWVGEINYWVELVGDDNLPFYFQAKKIRSSSYKNFVTLGYYEKMKQTFVGKEFYSTGRYEIEKVDVKEKVEPPFKVKFKCTGIAANVGEDGFIFAVLENEKYGKIKGEIIKAKKLNHFISVSNYNEFIRKYGAKFGSWVAEGKIEIGMNKNMVRDAWGDPDDINRTEGSYGTHEQWVYGKRYLYFKNGKLTSMQL